MEVPSEKSKALNKNNSWGCWTYQCAKKVMSDILWLVDFAIGLVNILSTWPTGKWCFFEQFEKQKNYEINSARQKAFRASGNDVCSGLVIASFSLFEWQAVKTVFFAPTLICSSLSFMVIQVWPFMQWKLHIKWCEICEGYNSSCPCVSSPSRPRVLAWSWEVWSRKVRKMQHRQLFVTKNIP